MKKNIRKLMGLLLVLAAAFILTACKKLEVDMNDFVEFTDEGYDGTGTSRAEFDYKEMLKDVKDKMKDERYSAARKILKEVTLSPETATNVSNGQTVTFEWDIDEDDVKELEDECKLIVKFDDVEHKVSGLTPLEEVDLFRDFTIYYDGYDTYGTVSYWYGESYAAYTPDKTENLSNGDTITVTASLDSWYTDSYKDIAEYLQARGQKPASLTKQIVVEGLSPLNEYDPFSSLYIEYSGIDGAGSAAIYTDWSDSYYYNWEYSLDRNSELSNGDVITVTVTAYDGSAIEDYAARYNGLAVTQSQKQFTVEGLTVLADSVDVIEPVGLLDLTEKGKQLIVQLVDGWEPTELLGVYKLGTVLGYEKDYWSEDYSPEVFVIYGVDVQNDADGALRFYWYIKTSDCVMTDEGNIVVDPEFYDSPANNYSSWWGVSGEAFYGPSGSLYYVGFETLEDLYTAKLSGSDFTIADDTVGTEPEVLLYPVDGEF